MKRRLGRSAAAFFVLLLATGAATQAQTFTTLHSFNSTDGAWASAALVQGTDGNFYGTTQFGANSACFAGCGTVFKITPSGTLTTLHGFDSTDGANPYPALVQGTDGNFYGTTQVGGASSAFSSACSQAGCGTVFKITPSGTLTTLYSFCSQSGCTDGTVPDATLVQATDGNFYGTTQNSGANGRGTVFKITPSGTLTTLYSFCSQSGCTDGSLSLAGLVQATDGNFYGTTDTGGASSACTGGCGTVFKITPSGTLTTLHSFAGTDGKFLFEALVQAADGNFYGTTLSGGANGNGTVFKITPSGTLTTLYNFCSQTGCTDGAVPQATLVQATDGNFYGTTVGGGANGHGTVFKITPSGTLTTLHSFDSTGGANPYAGLVQGTDGNFYGTTRFGGASSACTGGCGTVFKLTVQTQPTIANISPTSAIAGGPAFALTVNGTNFVSGSMVNFNGSARTTSFVSTTQVTAVILASDIATAGTFNVTVSNLGGGTSNAVGFTVVTPQDATGAIINSVNVLFSQGVINAGQDNSLLAQLQHAISMTNAGKNAGAIGNLDSFISEVNDLLSSGVLSPSQAASLTNAAQSVIAAL